MKTLAPENIAETFRRKGKRKPETAHWDFKRSWRSPGAGAAFESKRLMRITHLPLSAGR